MRILLACATALLALGTTAAAQTVEPQGELTYPISARVVIPEGQKLTAGEYAHVQVKIRNTTTEAGRHQVAMPLQAVVLRSVGWTNGIPKDEWLRPIYGSTRQLPDGTVEHNTMAQQMTDLKFETGLLLPGEELTVELPFTPQHGTAQLTISYAVVPGNFDSQVLLAEPISPVGPGKVTVRYLPYSTETARARERVRGIALVKSTMRDDSSLHVGEAVLQFDVLPPSSGGEVLAPAAAGYLLFDRPLLNAVIEIARGDTAEAMVKVQRGKLQKRQLPAMTPDVPDLFAEDKPLDAQLPPDIGMFPQTAHAMSKPDSSGVTEVPVTAWWDLLEQARAKGYHLSVKMVRRYGSDPIPVLAFEKAH